MTYNVHGFVGTDHVYDPERVARVIEGSGATVVALQEVDFGRGPKVEPPALHALAERLGMQHHFTLTRDGARGHFGNAVLARHSLSLVAEGFLPRRRDEPRAVQWLRVVAENFELHLMNTHLSVRFRDRGPQIRALLGAEWLVQAGTDVPLVVCGDFNASPLSVIYRKLSRDLKDVQGVASRARGTWPAQRPLLRLDHMFVSRSITVRSCAVLDTGLARVASDHLPMLSELGLP
jgi:endonuclease/exonuclease/phosphatase family metal-dependent hydrolase